MKQGGSMFGEDEIVLPSQICKGEIAFIESLNLLRNDEPHQLKNIGVVRERRGFRVLSEVDPRITTDIVIPARDLRGATLKLVRPTFCGQLYRNAGILLSPLFALLFAPK
jgi:hypothetical protein